MKKRWYALIAAVAILIVAIISLGIYSEYVEIFEIGKEYTQVFFKDIITRFEMIGIIFLVVFIVGAINLFVIRKNTKSITGDIPVFLKRKFIFLGSGALALFAGVTLSASLYRKFLLFVNSVDSGIKDPVFNLDITYFFFSRDFFKDVAAYMMGIIIVSIIGVIAFYFAGIIKGDIWEIKTLTSHSGVFSHVAVNVIALCVVWGLNCFLEAQGLILSQTGTVLGAGYTDVHVRLPFYTYIPYVIFIIAALCAVFLFRKKYKASIITVAILPVLFIGMEICAWGMDVFYVAPNETTLEKPYIERNIEYTKLGYKLQDVVERTFPAEETLTREDIEAYSDIINNIRITDPKATEEVLNSTKSIRSYYSFYDSDIVEYEVDGKPTAVNVAVRELDVTKLDANANNYINRTFKYTHGYGITMNPVNWVNSEGQPDFVIENMPITSDHGAPIVTQPRIYYGEKTNNYCIVDTTVDEFDYALNNENVEKNYEGTKSGIKLNMLNRLIFSVKNSDYTMLISGYVNSESRLLTNRNIIKRVNKAVPFMYIDSDPYIVIDSEGKLKWVVDLYTASNNMPYSKSIGNINYIRNSAKAVVDAYEGTVEVYITDETDSIVMTYHKIYPSVMKLGGLPEDIEAHIRYPEYLFDVQSEIYLRYHMDDPEIFYSNSDLWMRAKEKYRGDEAVDVQPYYNLLSVEDFGRDGAQLVLMMPFVPANKENLVSWLATDNYGNMISYKFPSGRTVYGTLHIENRIDADADISKELSLWDQGGSQVLRGNVLVIPIKDSVIYVEPVYITTSNNAAVPEVKRVIVAYGDRVVMRSTLNECLDVLFGRGDIVEENTPTYDEAVDATEGVDEIIQAYDKLNQAMTKGDWNAFAIAMEELEEAINKHR